MSRTNESFKENHDCLTIDLAKVIVSKMKCLIANLGFITNYIYRFKPYNYTKLVDSIRCLQK